MTMRYRKILVAFALVVLAAWVTLNWMRSSSSPAPIEQPSPTGAIGPAPATFVPNDGTTPSATSP
jgi:hypothetical protein